MGKEMIQKFPILPTTHLHLTNSTHIKDEPQGFRKNARTPQKTPDADLTFSNPCGKKQCSYLGVGKTAIFRTLGPCGPRVRKMPFYRPLGTKMAIFFFFKIAFFSVSKRVW